jgi:hypothetical protein
MKFSAFSLLSALLLPLAASAADSSLFVKEGKELIDVQSLIKNEEDVYAAYGFDNFCYEGNSQVVIAKMKKWSAGEFFFSGGGGGFVLKKITLIRGFVSYDLQMVLEDEVVPGEFKSIMIKPCSFKF